MTDKEERYRLAWLSAKRGRASWKGLYLGTIDPRRYDPLGLRFLNLARKHAKRIRELEQIRTTLQDDHVTAWNRVRELESELSDLRLAASEAQGAQAREAEQVFDTLPEGDDDDPCGALPPKRADDPDTLWGDCWCTLRPGHDGDCFCVPCTKRAGAPGWPHEPGHCTDEVYE